MNIVLWWLWGVSMLFAIPIPQGYWNNIQQVLLKKDQMTTLRINIDQDEYNVSFRWTLYKNEGMVMHYEYRGFRNQNILYKNTPLNSFMISMREPRINGTQAPFIMITFKEYNPKDKTGLFEIGFRDNGRQMLIDRVR